MNDRARLLRDAEAELRGLVRRVVPGATIYFPRRRAHRVGHSWNGRHLRPTGMTLESQLHEVAHLLLASPRRRTMVEFGLGPDPYRRNDVPCVIPREDADREELHTCWMQLLLARLLTLDVDAVRCEFQLPPLTHAMVKTLVDTYPEALPPRWWSWALAVVAS
ncbi:MAG: hypothetical protein AAF799_24055 [Myxococcota bacterium]